MSYTSILSGFSDALSSAQADVVSGASGWLTLIVAVAAVGLIVRVLFR
jgi:hypothetical protein